jgi:hypothetical protein
MLGFDSTKRKEKMRLIEKFPQFADYPLSIITVTSCTEALHWLKII